MPFGLRAFVGDAHTADAVLAQPGSSCDKRQLLADLGLEWAA
ncbi:hypothetical protein ACFVX6_37440 [Streptomyces sp. NPDC058289]